MKQSRSELRKISEGVFDRSTLMSLYKASRAGYFDELQGIISTGKESNVYYGFRGDMEVAVKIYAVEASDFKNMEKYIVGDHRFGGWRNRRQLIYMWAQKEFRNLGRLYPKVRCPRPVGVVNNILVMGFMGEGGVAAPRLKDLPPEDPLDCFRKVTRDMRRMYGAGIVHADLSEYNILNWGDPYIIDLSTGVVLDHPLADEFLGRDVKNICKYFSGLGVKREEGDVLRFIKDVK